MTAPLRRTWNGTNPEELLSRQEALHNKPIWMALHGPSLVKPGYFSIKDDRELAFWDPDAHRHFPLQQEVSWMERFEGEEPPEFPLTRGNPSGV